MHLTSSSAANGMSRLFCAGASLRQRLPLVVPITRLPTISSARSFSIAAALRPTAVHRSGFHYKKTRLSPEDAVDPLSKPSNIDKAALHVVSVPIGNLKDFTLRALDVLRSVDYIITSDRPATKSLLDLVQIPSQGRLIHYSRSNHTASRAKLVELLKGGRSMAFLSTSGTPCVGDVGGELVQEMQRHGIRVTAVPGASAVMSALAISGLTTSPFEVTQRGGDGGTGGSPLLPRVLQDGSFFFGNVLPESHGARLRLLRSIVAPATYPCVFYEVPRRLLTVLLDIAAVMPLRRVYVTHELTKLNESLHADTAEALVAFYARQGPQLLLKGQLVLIIAAAGPKETGAWLAKEAVKRQRLRKSLRELAGSTVPSQFSEVKKMSVSVRGQSTQHSSESPRALTRLQRRRELLRKRRRLKREKLIREIEQEQERLRVNFAVNRNDALKDVE